MLAIHTQLKQFQVQKENFTLKNVESHMGRHQRDLCPHSFMCVCVFVHTWMMHLHAQIPTHTPTHTPISFTFLLGAGSFRFPWFSYMVDSIYYVKVQLVFRILTPERPLLIGVPILFVSPFKTRDITLLISPLNKLKSNLYLHVNRSEILIQLFSPLLVKYLNAFLELILQLCLLDLYTNAMVYKWFSAPS